MDEIAQNLRPALDHTQRNRYADWPGAMIEFCERYRTELREVELRRSAIDIAGLRQELNTRHALGL